jgi:hypothetical protein
MMAGKPKQRERERLEAEAAKRRAARANPNRRRAAVLRAEAVGDELASREFNVERSTIRSWRRHVKREGPEPTPAEPVAQAETPRPTSGLEAMRKARDAARAAEADAVAQTRTLLAAGQAREAQAASVAGGVWSDKALALDKAIVAAEAERQAEAARLTQAGIALQAAVVRGTFQAVDLPVPTRTMRTLGEQAQRGEALEVPEEIARADRERIRAPIRAEHLDELLAEGWRAPGEPAAVTEREDGAVIEPERLETAPEEPDRYEGRRDLPLWSEVGEEGKHHWGDGPAGRLAARTELYNERVAQRQRQRVGGSDLRAPSRFAREFRGPAARGGR